MGQPFPLIWYRRRCQDLPIPLLWCRRRCLELYIQLRQIQGWAIFSRLKKYEILFLKLGYGQTQQLGKMFSLSLSLIYSFCLDINVTPFKYPGLAFICANSCLQIVVVSLFIDKTSKYIKVVTETVITIERSEIRLLTNCSEFWISLIYKHNKHLYTKYDELILQIITPL